MSTHQHATERAQSLDARDPLASHRKRFHIPRIPSGGECIYFCGNSLGLQPLSTRDYVEEALKDWEELGVEGHVHAHHPWVSYHELLTDQTARLVGALPGEVVVMNSVTVNLHLMLVSFFRPTRTRYRIAMEASAFPSDRYAVISHLAFHGLDPATALVEFHPRDGEHTLRTGDIEETVRREGESIAVILLGGVNYYTGQAFELDRITRAGNAHGCTVGFDLSHAAGNILLRLHEWDVDFAVWCSYKYLNGGPGAVAGCFVHERHGTRQDLPRFAGWWGHDKETRFRMGPSFVPIPGAEGWQLSNPPILPLAALRASMEIFDEVGMEALRKKSIAQSAYFRELLGDDLRFDILTPADPDHAGAQLSVRVPGGRSFHGSLNSAGVVCDWREPDVVRLAPVPLYNSFDDIRRCVDIMKALAEGDQAKVHG